MTRTKWISAAVGAGVAVAVLLPMRMITEDFLLARLSSPRAAMLWALVLGVGVGLVAFLSVRFDPLVAAVPAALLFLAYLPMLIDLSVPDWYPGWLGARIHTSFSPLPYGLIGVLATAAVWPSVERRRVTTLESPVETLTD